MLKENYMNQTHSKFSPRWPIAIFLFIVMGALQLNAQSANNDAGLNSVQSPSATICAGTQSVTVNLQNFGFDTLKTDSIYWWVNGVEQTAILWTGSLATGSSETVTLGNFNFATGPDTVFALSSSPNGVLDSVASNDTVSLVVTVNPLPPALAATSSPICNGDSVQVYTTVTSGNTYSWASNPVGFVSTSPYPYVQPSSTTTYYLTETITATGCHKTDSTVLVINPAPLATIIADQAICSGASVSIGATAVSGDTYSWTSNPAGFSDTTSNPNVSPTATTTYYLTESITATGCSASDSVVITVNPLPAASNAGNKAICSGSLTLIGATAVTGNTYTWSSNPAGFSDNGSNPSVSPTATTTYYLTESVTATGCSQSDTLVITVNPLPSAANGGSQSICNGSSASIGATAVSGDTYSWASNPAGFSDTTSNPSVSPATTTTYYLTESITTTGCWASDSVVITVNPLPSAANGGNQSICIGSSASIGATEVSGDTYSWTSNPHGFSDTTSNPSVNPTTTTTYYLTESITATGCSQSDSVVLTVNPLPSASVGSGQLICSGSSASIGATAVSGDTYSWTSNPSGYSNTTSNPSVSPATTTTYYLNESITATGCSASDSVIITTNPLPAAANNGNQSICSGSSVSIGAVAVTGDSYSWTSNPSGFSDTTSNPSVNPTTTTTYYLTESITATGCSQSDSVVITVNPLPSANAGSGQSICNGASASIGAAAVTGDTYSWTSNPSGFSDTTSNPSVSPTATTTYYLTESITATGCSKSDSVVVSANPLPSAANSGNQSVCIGSFISIGDTAVSGDTYSWSSNPPGFSDTTSNPSVNPTTTTTYYLTESITATGCSNSDSVVITVNPLPSAAVGGSQAICNGSSASIGATTVSGDSYSWKSSPTGFSDTTSSPSVSPTATTTYYLTESITATGCSKSDSVIVIVNPSPSASTGGNLGICSGSSVTIGAAHITGDNYSWTSNPAGFSDTSSNPNVSPIATTTYYLTETIAATACSKSDSVIITVKTAPNAKTGGNQAICNGASISIGDTAVIGNTYTWTSNPSGFSDTSASVLVSPSITTTYYLTETVAGGGCSKSDSAIITVNPLPKATTGGNQFVCFGSFVLIGDTNSVVGNTYVWASNPSGFSDTTSSAMVSPTVTTTYYLTESITATGCSKSDSAILTVSTAVVNAGSSQTICSGSPASIGDTAVIGNAYTWTSNPAGFSDTSAMPTVYPVVTTTYYLTESLTASGCSKSDSVVITVNPAPAAYTVSNMPICFGGSVLLGKASVTGDSYIWTSSPIGFSDTSADPNVNPGVTTTYYLTESITATGCSKSDSVVITVNPVPNDTFSQKVNLANVTFTPADSTLAFYSWSFGDGTTDSSEAPTHIYASSGTFEVHLTVTSHNGCVASDSQSVVISLSKSITASFMVNDTNCIQSVTSFNDSTVSNSCGTINTWLWTFGDGNTSTSKSPTHTYTATGSYTVKLVVSSSGGCSDSISKTIYVDSSCVWAGDVSHNSVVDTNDVLDFGIAYNETGPKRLGASTNWNGQYCDNWTKSFASGVNHKNADCNGDGVVDSNDMKAIILNYGDTHLKTGANKTGNPANPPLFLTFANLSYSPGDTVKATIMLGPGTNSLTNVYGLEAAISFDAGFVDTNSVKINFNNSWFGTQGTNMLSFVHSEYSGNSLLFAITRIDHNNVSGNGGIGSFSFVIPSNASSKQTVHCEFVSSKVIAFDESIIPTYLPDDTFGVQISTGIQNTDNVSANLKVSPNPFTSNLNISYSLAKTQNMELTVTDITGKQIATLVSGSQSLGQHIYTLDAAKYNMQAGVYFLKMVVNGSATNLKFIKVN